LGRLLAEAQEYISAEDHGSDTSSIDDSSDGESMTELQALFGEVVTIIQCLYKLAMIIRSPAQHDFLAESYKTDTTAFEPFDEQHVCNKFPQANEELILRLAKALTRRRGYLRYRARHSKKLEKGLEDIQLGGGGVAASISETTASVLQAQPVDYNETSSDSGISQTSYANSIVEGGTITVPPPPKGSLAGNPFPCPYCHFIINPTTTHSWHRHVFTDLRPYTCVYQPCRTPDKLYPSRHGWLDHIRNTHDIKSLLCPLCKAVMETLEQYERHVARHMEELALFVLPRSDFDEEEEREDPDDRGISDSDSEGNQPLRGTDDWLENTKHNIDITEDDQEGFRYPDLDTRNRSQEHTELPWQCKECKKRFSTQEILYQHTATHGNDHRSLSVSTDRVSDVYSKRNPYSCVYPGCTRTFLRRADLDRHMNDHPHTKHDCPLALKQDGSCNRMGENGFPRKDKLEDHLKRVHMLDLPKSARGTRS
ncbi:MAG: hypothetical protein Q9180_005967, partial [Flavoplaca navasiana]